MSKINKIRLSGTTYDIEDSGATKTVEVTQAEYDALVSGGTVDPNTFYVITDATAADLSQYWTSAQTQSAITNAVSGKQDTLSAGTGIDITDNVISATGGGGGGTTYSAGTNISIDSSNNINCTIPLSAGTGTRSVKGGNYANASSDDSFAFGSFVNANGVRSVAFGDDNRASKQSSFACGFHNESNGEIGSFATGFYNKSTSGQTDSGNTLFSVGNGTANNARHNAFEIKTNGDIYITSGSSDIKLQDHLGGGSITVDPSLDSGSTNAVANSAITEALEGKQNKLTATGWININEIKNRISTTLPIYQKSQNSNGTYTMSVYGNNPNYPNNVTGKFALAVGENNTASGRNSLAYGGLDAYGEGCSATSTNSVAIGRGNLSSGLCTIAKGYKNQATNQYEESGGRFNLSNKANTTWGDSGNTLFSVGNGTADNARHNAFEIRQNGDIYIEKGGSDVKLQDIIPSTTSAVTSGSTAVVESGAVYDQLGGMKIVKLTESEYTALVTKDESTLYVVVPDPSN